MEILLFIFSLLLSLLVYFNTKRSVEVNFDYLSKSISQKKYWFGDYNKEKIFLNFSMNLAVISLLLSPAYLFIGNMSLNLLTTIIMLLSISNLIFYFEKTSLHNKYKKIKLNKNKINQSYVMNYLNCDDLFVTKLCFLQKTKCKNLACLINVVITSTLLIGFVVVQTISKQTELKKIDELHYAWKSLRPIWALFFIWILK